MSSQIKPGDNVYLKSDRWRRKFVVGDIIKDAGNIFNEKLAVCYCMKENRQGKERDISSVSIPLPALKKVEG